MAIIKIKSENPDLSYVLSKNPNSGIVMRGLRQGTVSGWFESETEYYAFFRDGADEISFKESPDQSFEYLNVEKYISPAVYIGIITTLFDTPLKKVSERDVSGSYLTSVSMVMKIDAERYIDFFKRNFKNVAIVENEIAKNVYDISFATNESIHYLINLVNVFLLFTAVISKKTDMAYNRVDEQQLDKFIKSLEAIQAPYYLVYLFKKNFMKSFRKFNELYKERLIAINPDFDDIVFGSTFDDRMTFVGENLTLERNILDIGCGEGNFVLRFQNKIGENFYHAVDIDQKVIEKLSRKLEHRAIENVALYNNIKEFESDEMVDVLLIEVIEHMSVSEASKLLEYVLKNVNFNRILITTPDNDFNKYYGMLPDELRHLDHDYEFTFNGFKRFIEDAVGEEFDFSIGQIGDTVNGTLPTSACVITKKSTN